MLFWKFFPEVLNSFSMNHFREEPSKSLSHIYKRYILNAFKQYIHKMVKHTQAIRQLTANELFECVWPFCGVGAKRVDYFWQGSKHTRLSTA